MHHRIGSALLAISLLAGCGGAETDPASEPLASQQAPLTQTDVDVAPECQGILSFANTASFATLDAYLPSDVATHLVARRDTAPFTSVADLMSVPLVGEARLTQLEHGARALGYIDSSCVGIMDQLAVSQDDAAAIVSLVNSASPSTLYAILPYSWNGATQLLAQRPFTSVQAISQTFGIGPASLRELRNAATMGYMLSVLAAEVNAVPNPHYPVNLHLFFDVNSVLDGVYGNSRFSSGQCFGIDLGSRLEDSRWSIRPDLASADEVFNEVYYAANIAYQSHEVSYAAFTQGLDNLNARIQGRTFKGCILNYSNGPWSGIRVAFYQDTASGFQVLTRVVWTE